MTPETMTPEYLL